MAARSHLRLQDRSDHRCHWIHPVFGGPPPNHCHLTQADGISSVGAHQVGGWIALALCILNAFTDPHPTMFCVLESADFGTVGTLLFHGAHNRWDTYEGVPVCPSERERRRTISCSPSVSHYIRGSALETETDEEDKRWLFLGVERPSPIRPDRTPFPKMEQWNLPRRYPSPASPTFTPTRTHIGWNSSATWERTHTMFTFFPMTTHRSSTGKAGSGPKLFGA